jgi:hypothetical protein
MEEEMVKSRSKKPIAPKNQRQAKRKQSAAGKKAAITKTLTAAKRSAAGKRAGITKVLTDAQRTAAAKWAWVTRQLKAK